MREIDRRLWDHEAGEPIAPEPDSPIVMLLMQVRCGYVGWTLNGTAAAFMWSSVSRIGNLYLDGVTPGGAWSGYG